MKVRQVTVLIEKRPEGGYYIHSPEVSGLHLWGMELKVLRDDLFPVMKDLYWYKEEIAVDDIRFIPDLDRVIADLEARRTPEYKLEVRSAA